MISALLKGWWRTIADAIEAGRLELAASPAAIEEFRDVAGRPRVQRLVAPEDADGIADLLGRAVLAAPADVPAVCRDPSDDYLLALAVAVDADVLVTRDEDLLTLQRHGQTEIIHVAAFLARIAASPE